MKAIIWTKYGKPDVLQLQEIPKPIPKDNEVLIKIYATTVTAGDCEARAFKFPAFIWLPARIGFGIFKPRKKILGQELAGEIEAVGKSVTKFKKGDQIFAASLFRFGTYAEYLSLPETHPIALKPENVSYGAAATIPTGGLNGLHFVKKSNLKPGEKLLINGAGGSIGTYGVQIAKSLGAEVTCVDRADKLEMLTSIGADHVIDYEKEDFTQNGKTYDAIIDVVGKSSFSRSLKSLNPNGRYILGNPRLGIMLRGAWVSKTTDKKVISEMADYKMEDILYLKNLIEEGKLKPVIDTEFPLEKMVEAHEYVEKGDKKGNLVISVFHEDA